MVSPGDSAPARGIASTGTSRPTTVRPRLALRVGGQQVDAVTDPEQPDGAGVADPDRDRDQPG